MSAPVLGSATARIVGRRRCSKRLAFYDLRELVDVDPELRGVLEEYARLDAETLSKNAAAKPTTVELVAKAHTEGFQDEASLAAAQKDTLKLGNVVRVRGTWSVSENAQGTKYVALACESIEVIEVWTDKNPGKHFQKLKDVGIELRKETTGKQSQDPLLPCKYWINQGYCHKGSVCKYAHVGDRSAEAKKWIDERRQRRRTMQMEEMKTTSDHGNVNSHDMTVGPSKTKSHRASIFADWLVETFGVEILKKGTGVLDVAGGRGDVSWELHAARGIKCTLVEPRQRKLNKAQHKWIKKKLKSTNASAGDADGARVDPSSHPSQAEESLPDEFLCPQVRAEFCSENFDQFKDCSVIVGMHPDQATDPIAEFAVKYNKSFAIVPCCVFPTLFPDRRVLEREDENNSSEKKTKETPVTNISQLITYLATKTNGHVSCLDFEGANRVVWGKGS